MTFTFFDVYFWNCYVLTVTVYVLLRFRLCDVNVMKLLHYKNSYDMKFTYYVMQQFVTFTFCTATFCSNIGFYQLIYENTLQHCRL